jgi:hypothetical protein
MRAVATRGSPHTDRRARWVSLMTWHAASISTATTTAAWAFSPGATEEQVRALTAPSTIRVRGSPLAVPASGQLGRPPWSRLKRCSRDFAGHHVADDSLGLRPRG